MTLPDTLNIWTFAITGLALNVTPGPDMLYTAMRTLSQGRRAGLVSALGIGSGCFVHTCAAALGMSAILAQSTSAFQLIKYAGAAYLVYLGYRSIRDNTQLSLTATMPSLSLRSVFFQGVVTNVLNPKVALFFLSFLPQFVNPEKGHVANQMVFLGSVFIFTGTIVLAIVVFGVTRLARVFDRFPVIGRNFRWLTGTVLIGLGIKLALAEQR